MIFNRFQRIVLATLAVVLAGRGARCEDLADGSSIVRSAETEAAIHRPFSPDELELLDAIQRGCFHFLWNEVGRPSHLTKDRRYAQVASVAGVGFQLAALPIAVEREWVTREQAEARAAAVLRALDRDDIRRRGMYFHFLRADDGGVYSEFRNEVSTVDTALLLAGAMVAAEYFGGAVASDVDRLVASADWRNYADPETNLIRFGWWPDDNRDPSGPGRFIPQSWRVASDEERLIYFLAVGAPIDEFAAEPRLYFTLQRTVQRHADMPPFVVSPSGSLFMYFYSHVYIDYRRFLADDPSLFGVDAPRVDWVENSRRATLTHRRRCLEASADFASFAADRWGVSPCMALDDEGKPTYIVPEVRPNLSNRENWHGGWIPPYAAACSMMFAPEESLAAMRAYREIADEQGQPLVWREPALGGYGFAESFRLVRAPTGADAPAAAPTTSSACDDHVSIDVGVMLLALENVRTGLIWRLFMQHPVAARAVEQLRLTPRADFAP